MLRKRILSAVLAAVLSVSAFSVASFAEEETATVVETAAKTKDELKAYMESFDTTFMDTLFDKYGTSSSEKFMGAYDYAQECIDSEYATENTVTGAYYLLEAAYKNLRQYSAVELAALVAKTKSIYASNNEVNKDGDPIYKEGDGSSWAAFVTAWEEGNDNQKSEDLYLTTNCYLNLDSAANALIKATSYTKSQFTALAKKAESTALLQDKYDANRRGGFPLLYGVRNYAIPETTTPMRWGCIWGTTSDSVEGYDPLKVWDVVYPTFVAAFEEVRDNQVSSTVTRADLVQAYEDMNYVITAITGFAPDNIGNSSSSSSVKTYISNARDWLATKLDSFLATNTAIIDSLVAAGTILDPGDYTQTSLKAIAGGTLTVDADTNEFIITDWYIKSWTQSGYANQDQSTVDAIKTTLGITNTQTSADWQALAYATKDTANSVWNNGNEPGAGTWWQFSPKTIYARIDKATQNVEAFGSSEASVAEAIPNSKTVNIIKNTTIDTRKYIGGSGKDDYLSLGTLDNTVTSLTRFGITIEDMSVQAAYSLAIDRINAGVDADGSAMTSAKWGYVLRQLTYAFKNAGYGATTTNYTRAQLIDLIDKSYDCDDSGALGDNDVYSAGTTNFNNDGYLGRVILRRNDALDVVKAHSASETGVDYTTPYNALNDAVNRYNSRLSSYPVKVDAVIEFLGSSYAIEDTGEVAITEEFDGLRKTLATEVILKALSAENRVDETIRLAKNNWDNRPHSEVVVAYNALKSAYEALEEAGPAVAGDVNGDGAMTAADATSVLKHVAEIAVLEGDALAAADFNGDGAVTAADATAILKALIA